MTDTTDIKEQENLKRLDAIREAATLKSGGKLVRPGTPPAPIAIPPVPARSNRSDGFGLVAKAPDVPSQGGIVGRLLKFRKGEFSTDRGATPIDLGSAFIVLSVAEQWCRFESQELIETRKREDDSPFPSREELGFLDRAKWQPGPDGTPADPWSKQFYLWLSSTETLGDFTFVSQSIGGTKAIRNLCQQIAYRRESSGVYDLCPVVKLAVSRWNSKKYGLILSPDFPIQSWVDGALRPVAERSPAEEIDDSVTY